MIRHGLVVIVIALAGSSLAAGPLVVYRHDRTDAEAVRLAERFAAVGRVEPDGACTLVRPHWAVTAAHVAASVRPGGRVHFDAGPAIVKRTVIHPQGTGPRGQPPEVDLALIEFEQPVAGIQPMALHAGRDELGKTVTIVGYGDYGVAGALRRTDHRRRAVTNVLDDAGPLRLFVSFDRPPGGLALEGVGGPGDSGGPALLEAGGTVSVAGISSGAMNGRPGEYGLVDVYTRVSSHLAWIEGVLSGRP